MLPFLPLALLLAFPDRVVLVNGGVLEGTITREDEKTIEIELASGGIVGLERSRTVEIVREPRPAGTVAGGPQAFEVSRREEWFLVRDGRGGVVGTRSAFRSADPFRGTSALRLEEVWRFFGPDGETLVSEIEWADPAGAPLGFQYREDSPRRALLLVGEVRGERLHLSAKGPGGAREDAHPFPRGTRLPLIARDGLREKQLGSGRAYSFSVFDPREGTFVRRDFECPVDRRAPIGGGDLPIPVLVETRFGRRSEEWFDPRRGTVLLEANGPDLVAHRCTPEEAARAKDAPFDPTGGLITAANGRLRFSLPNPNWEPAVGGEGGEGGAAFFRDRAGGALLCVFPLTELDPEVLLDGACVALEARLRSTVEGYTRTEMPREASVRGIPARELRFEARGPKGKVFGRAVAVRGERDCLALVLLTPEAALALASADFDRFLAAADLAL
ncbi:MAG TPA: hypothetical protein VFI25_04855 [Planctomycetota bacterium]|nr:hypothetical protein [Planctomycetota bacterium]